MSKLITAATFNGNKQYPRRQMLWKREIVPPKSYPLRAITPPPSHTMKNTIENKSDLSSALVATLRTVASMRQKKKGPHKSQFLISLRFSSVSTLEIGLMTILSFYQILIKSLLIVSDTGSSRVLNTSPAEAPLLPDAAEADLPFILSGWNP